MKNYVKQKTIGIDARLYGPSAKGLGRYVEEIVNGITRVDGGNNYVIFLSEENFDLFSSNNSKVRKVLAKSRWYTLAEQITMPYLIWREGIELMHIPHFNVPILCTAKFVVTIHDLILTKFPSKRASTLSPLAYKIKYYFYQIIIKNALRKSEKIIAVSQFTKDDIVDQFKIDPEKIVVTYEGVSKKITATSSLDKDSILAKYSVSKPFIMYVGNAYPHKNLEGLIDEFASLKNEYQNLQLVLVGGEDYFYKRLKKKVKEANISKIVFTGFIPDDELAVLYKQAKAYIFPSKFEGFGLPPLEAMAQGCAVISSSKTCLPEVLGEAAIYFNPDKSGWLLNSLLSLDKGAKHSDLVKKGLEQVQNYSWDDCVEQTREVYQNLL